MRFSDRELSLLLQEIKPRLSEGRYLHTLGVKEAALRLAAFFDDIDKSEISAAALLHDITKEYSAAEHKNILLSYEGGLNDYDLASEPVLHSLSAPYIVLRDFADFATDNVLSSVRHHTLASTHMSVFDEIIFLADYVEDGRTYPACIEARASLYHDLSNTSARDERELALDRAMLKTLTQTVLTREERGECVHPQTLRSIDWFMNKLR